MQAGDIDPDIFFTDRPRGSSLGQRNRECISAFADTAPRALLVNFVLPFAHVSAPEDEVRIVQCILTALSISAGRAAQPWSATGTSCAAFGMRLPQTWATSLRRW